MTVRWYVVECFEGKDRDAYLRLAAAGYEVWRPVVAVRTMRRWKGRKTTGERFAVYAPVFGRYLFVRLAMADSHVGAIKEQRGVVGFLCYAGSNEPAYVPDELIAYYRTMKPERVETTAAFVKGDVVKPIAGPFAGLHGTVTRVDSRGVLAVDISIFGRPTPVIFPVGHVELVEHGRRPPIERDVNKRQRKRA